ncbi:hypothetical protein [Brevundimonas lenta]|uniref:Uncharacterized protein n=1 Tax=Brevundimonas lenta TaxID=424796 RepID=A0A7W6JF50_9CAUL|nr:hypothetical protein [Brevundimonas lenta]MBB4083961.1 hypothetical protein [Brevundimonas lenta]
MILLPLLLLTATPAAGQTSTAVMMVRAQVIQTCVLSNRTGARCHGARDRPVARRIIRSGAVTIFEF